MATAEIVCRICMEVPVDENYFMDAHQCTRCLPNAFVICFVCHGTVVSRLCPECHSDYGPVLLHKMPGFIIKTIILILKLFCKLIKSQKVLNVIS